PGCHGSEWAGFGGEWGASRDDTERAGVSGGAGAFGVAWAAVVRRLASSSVAAVVAGAGAARLVLGWQVAGFGQSPGPGIRCVAGAGYVVAAAPGIRGDGDAAGRRSGVPLGALRVRRNGEYGQRWSLGLQ